MIISGYLLRTTLERGIDMSRPTGPSRSGAAPRDSVDSLHRERARLATNIGAQALELARYARAAGLPTVGYMLETAALEAASEAATSGWPSDETA
jgi:hypothetical protein